MTSSHSIKSFAQLKEAIEYAYLSEDLFELLNHEENLRFLKQTLLATYFASTTIEENTSSGIIEQVKQQILNEDPALYKAKAEAFDEEEKFIRKGFFKKLIPKVYNFTCAITGMRLIANREIQMIDACHVVPFSYSQDDTVTNGISLCPNMHRAFDRGLIAIDSNFTVITSQGFSESRSDYTIKAYHGKRLMLPENEQYYPSLKNLEWHRINVFRY